MNSDLLLLAQIVLSVLLVILILFQQRGSGLSSPFGGESAGLLSFRSRRGVEKLIFFLTVFVAIVFFVTSLLLASS